MTTALDTATKALTDRISELDADAKKIAAERSQIEKALTALGSSNRSSPRGRRGPGRPKGSTAKPNRAPRGQRREQVLSHLSSNSPARPTDIAKAIDASSNQVHGLLSKLRKDKLVRKTGKGYSLTAAANGS